MHDHRLIDDLKTIGRGVSAIVFGFPFIPGIGILAVAKAFSDATDWNYEDANK